AMAFDDGPYPFTNNITDTLESHGARGTFFMNGNNWRCMSAEDVQERFTKGHMLGSHTWSHVDLATLNRAQLNRQFKLVEDAMKKILGVRPLYFRPPFGSYNDLVLEVAAERGYKGAITWDYDSGEFKLRGFGREEADFASGDTNTPRPTVKTMVANYNKLITTFPKPHLTLNHDVQETCVENMAQVCPPVVGKIKKKGYKMNTIVECLGIGDVSKAYVKTGKGFGKRDSTWTCEGTPAPGVP
ncbi:carbohydrate esterase family 4 protein, partial [Atractiella rhizophila]